MANEIKDKYSASAALTITLASLANTAGRQSTIISNATPRYQDLLVFVKLKSNGTPTANALYEIYLIRSDADGTAHRSDGAGASDAAFTPVNAQLIGTVRCVGSASEVDYGEFLVSRPGPEWGIAVFNRSGQALTATAGDHWVRYVGLNPEIQ